MRGYFAGARRGGGSEENFEIDIPMQKGAEVTVTAANGKTFAVASVAALPVKTRYPSYTASAWGEPGSVCASAVNAVHMLVSVKKAGGGR